MSLFEPHQELKWVHDMLNKLSHRGFVDMAHVSGDDDVSFSICGCRDNVPVRLGDILPPGQIVGGNSNLDRSYCLNEGNVTTAQFKLFFGLFMPGNPACDFLGNAGRIESYKSLMTGDV